MAKMRKMFAMKKTARERIKRLCSGINEYPGIYIFYRTDEEGFRYAYVGQAKNLLERCSNHLMGYQSIDLSIKKHGLFNSKNPYGWRLRTIACGEKDLDTAEKTYIKNVALAGYQLRNKTSGGQGEGKTGIADNKPSKGYRDGLAQGYKNCLRDVMVYFDKYLDFVIKGTPNKIKERKIIEFSELLGSKKDDN